MRDTQNRQSAPRRAAPPTAEQSRAQNARRHKRRRKGNHKLLYSMLALIFLSIGITLIFTVFFKVEQVQATGVTRYSEQQVVTSSGITTGMNMLRLNRGGIERNLLKQYSYFESVRIRLKLPNTVVIQATEAVPTAAIQQGGVYLLLSSRYRVLETTATTLPEGLPVIKGFGAMTLNAGEQLDTAGQEKIEILSERITELEKDYARDLEKGKRDTAAQKQSELETLRQQQELLTKEWEQRKNQLQALETFLLSSVEVGLEPIRYIDVGDPYNLSAGYDDRVVLELGSESELSYKMLMAKKVLEEECTPDFTGTVDVSIPKKAFVRGGDLPSLSSPDTLPERSSDVTDSNEESATTKESSSSSTDISTSSQTDEESSVQAQPEE